MREGIEMAETLHEMAVRMVKGEDCQPQCGKGCDKCPAYKLRSANGVCLVRRIAKVDNCEEQIEGLRAWAAEHPAPRYPTWREWQHSMFPDANANMYPCSFMSYVKSECDGSLCSECVNRQIPADIAEKLGIKPITTAKAVPEHDGCEGCRWMNKQEDEEPCKNCCGVMGGSAPDLWEED